MAEIKGLILSGGAGTRLRPITHTNAKQLVPVANKPVLFYGIEALVEAGVSSIGIIISPVTGAEIREAVGDGSAFGAEVTYIEQDRPAGLAHAVLTAEDFLDGAPFVMYLGDNLLKNGIGSLVDGFRRAAPDATLLLTEVADPRAYGVAELDGGRITRLVEKPENPPSNMALVGVYLFSTRIMDAARRLKPSARGELEITEAIQNLIDDGAEVGFEIVSGWWKDTGRLDDMLEANRLVLEQIETRLDGEVIDSKIEGRVIIEAGAVVRDSVVRGPAVIAAGAQVSEAYVGPYTSLGRDVELRQAEVEHSILLSGSSIVGLDARVEASLLGRDAKVVKNDRLPRSMRLLVGDRSEISIV